MSQTTTIMPDQFTRFGELLKFLRHRAGLTQREFSIAVNYSEGQISHLEHNQRAPDAAVLKARFVPALELEREPEWTARLLELAALSRGEPDGQVVSRKVVSPRHNLPTQLTSFVGREKELALVTELLRSTRLLTLTGVGGVGKTRLAIQVAHRILDRFTDGIWLVELAPLADTKLLAQSVARALRLPEEPGAPMSALIDYLRPKRLLLIVDNCEHLIEACAEMADALLRACPELCLLAISREPLAISGETCWTVPPLSCNAKPNGSSRQEPAQSEAERLFVERAQAVLPAFRVTGQNESHIARICQRVDGVPLAIELAAARVRGLEPEQIAARLDESFGLLTNGRRNALPRQRTLEATVDWSFALLTESERVLLRRLSVFSGGWTLEGAEKVCGIRGLAAEEILYLLMYLVDKSLVVAESAGKEKRYRLLETIRQYAANKLDESGEIEAMRESHLECFVRLAEQAEPELKGPEQKLWLNRLEAEHENLRAAWEWAIAHDPERALRLCWALLEFWLRRGYTNEAREKFSRLVARTEDWGMSTKRARALFLAGRVAIRDWDYSSALVLMEESLAIARAVESKPEIAFALGGVANALRGMGDTQNAKIMYEEALKAYQEVGNEWCVANMLMAKAQVAGAEGNYDFAQQMSEESIALFRNVGDLPSIVYPLNTMGTAAMLRADYECAATVFSESLGIAREYANEYQIGVVSWYLGMVLLHLGDIEEARRLMEESIDEARGKRNNGSISARLICLAGVVSAEGEPELAARLLGAGDAGIELAEFRLEHCCLIEAQHIRAAIRAQMDEASFAKGLAEGRALTFEQVMAIAHLD